MRRPATSPVLAVLHDPMLRVAAVLVLMLGAVVCSFGPYVSVLAVQRFALGDRGYAALLVTSTLVSVSAAVLTGIRSDQTANRRRLALWSCGFLALGTGLMTLLPSAFSFVLAHGLIIPVSTLFGQLFALARLAAQPYAPSQRDGIMAVIRALFALPFVVLLPLWSLAFSHGTPILAVYPVGLGLSLAMLTMTARAWPKDGATSWQDLPSGLSLRAALAEMANRPLALRVLALGAVNSTGTLSWAVLALVLVPAVGRGSADVALYAGVTAGLEVPFMLALPIFLRRLTRSWMILIGTGVYCVHLLGLPLLAGSPVLWLLMLPAAAGGAAILTLPIAYLQDLLAERPGTGASLMALQRLTGDVMAAGCFALGTALSGYGLVAVLGALVALSGALVLLVADRWA